MKKIVQSLLAVLLVLGLVFAIREFFPKEKIIRTPPEIVTRFDTVMTLDTVEIVKWRERVVRDTVETVREVVHTVGDTVQCVDLSPTTGITGISAGQSYGDSTIVRGHYLFPAHDGSVVTRLWRENLFTLGPIQTVAVLDGSVPARIEFGDFPTTCELGCKAKIVGITSAVMLPVGAFLWELAR